MNRNRTHHRGRTVFLCAAICLCMAGLAGRLFFLMLYKADYYSQMAEELHRRERSIKAPRGRILDRNGTVIADNRTVCTISVIHNQVKDPETVIRVLSEELGLPEAEVRKKNGKTIFQGGDQVQCRENAGRCDPGNAPGGGQGG